MTGLGWSAAVAVEGNEGEEDAATAGGGAAEEGSRCGGCCLLEEDGAASRGGAVAAGRRRKPEGKGEWPVSVCVAREGRSGAGGEKLGR